MADEVSPDAGCETSKKSKSDKECKHHHHRSWCGPFIGPLWCIGWLFTIGFLKLPFFWKGVLALIIWPYYLGRFFAP